MQICGPFVPDNRAKFGDPRLNLSREIPLEAVCGCIFDVFCCNFRPEVVSGVISSPYVGHVSMDVPVKFGDSSSSGSRDIQQQSRHRRHFRPFFNFDNCQSVTSYPV